MKKHFTQKRKDFLEVFDYERRYDASKSADYTQHPIVPKLLLSIANALRFIGKALIFLCLLGLFLFIFVLQKVLSG